MKNNYLKNNKEIYGVKGLKGVIEYNAALFVFYKFQSMTDEDKTLGDANKLSEFIGFKGEFREKLRELKNISSYSVNEMIKNYVLEDN